MALFPALLLKLIHFIYALAIALRSFWKRQTNIPPLPLDTPRKRIPNHLALLLVVEPYSNAEQIAEALVQSVTGAVEWCRTVGIKRLTVYEESGLVTSCSKRIYDTISSPPEECSSESDIDYPLTPPPSDYSESRSLSPQQREDVVVPSLMLHIPSPSAPRFRHRSTVRKTKRKNVASHRVSRSPRSFSLCLISSEASKPAIASAARHLVQKLQSASQNPSAQPRQPFRLSIDELNALLENEDAVSSPDFMIIHAVNSVHHRPAYELHGFPPWHIRLTELFYSDSYSKPTSWRMRFLGNHKELLTAVPLNETTFRQALDEYTLAEMRFGK